MAKEKQRAGKGAGRRFEGGQRWIYLVGGLVLAALLIAAFAAPKLIFTIQDILRSEHMVLIAQEKSDISAFSTKYERALYRRLANYADGIAEGRTYYAAAQDVEKNADLMAFLVSDQTGLRQDGVLFLEELGFVPDFLSTGQPEIKECRQYVIYGDDFAEGVNFILRYLELDWGDADSPKTMKLLLDGESGAVYGLRWEAPAVDLFHFNPGEVSIAEHEYIDEWQMRRLVCRLALEIGGYGDMLDLEHMSYAIMGMEAHEENATVSEEAADRFMEQYIVEAGTWMTEEQVQYVRNLMEGAGYRLENDGNRLVFEIPYGESVLPYIVESKRGAFGYNTYWTAGKYRISYNDMTMGFPDIYRMVPEFNRE